MGKALNTHVTQAGSFWLEVVTPGCVQHEVSWGVSEKQYQHKILFYLNSFR